MGKEVILSFSGGLDSTTALAWLLAHNCLPEEMLCVGFLYGSKHNQYEQRAAAQVAQHYGVEHRVLDLTGAMAGFKSALMQAGGEIPEGHYAEESMRQTVMPCRNLIFIGVLAGLAESEDACGVWLGVHAGDHYIYPDCRPEFIQAAARAVRFATDGKVQLLAPFLSDSKAHVLARGLRLKAPYHLTRTCYKDQEVACGKCGSCQERLEAFALNGKEDPLPYESRTIQPKKE